MRTVVLGLAALLSLCGLSATGAEAQLLSPGRLIEAHAELEGALNCTQCHQLRQRGVSASKCLSCHTPLRARIARDRGFHSQIADQDCGSCHTDHAGRTADVVRFESADFQHREAGFALEGAHTTLACAACHTSERIVDREVRRHKAAGGTLARTYLGLSATCLGCHRREDPHGGQFDRTSCESCHTNQTWSDLEPFDHAETAYPLTGAHLQADCGRCHGTAAGTPALQYKGLEFAGCASCHSDPHRATLGNACSSCHGTSGWSSVSSARIERSFNHAATGFPLRGVHAEAECASCHTVRETQSQATSALTLQWQRQSSTGYPPPVVDRGCLSCHADFHEGDLAGARDGPDCRGCHTERAWTPSAFDFAMHDRTNFPLEDAHQAVLCEACHTSTAETGAHVRMTFQVAWSDCRSCHGRVDPHRGQFGDQDCAQCHTAETFRISSFDHDETRFPLDETHELPCVSCHTDVVDSDGAFVRFTPMGTQCRDCHT